MIKAGRFEITASGPYPVWITVFKDGERLTSFSHKELSDLQYVVNKAMQEARIMLKTTGDEDEV